jgi:poly-gamma-glutamate synthesis protein (capsule biosynthesis protein)
MARFDANGTYRAREVRKAWRLVVAGDLCPMGEVEEALLQRRYDVVPGTGVLSVLRQADVVHVNLESPLCSVEKPIVKSGPNFHASVAVASRLREVGITAVGLANNHIMDQGPDGLRETIPALEATGIGWHGAASSYETATKPLVVETPYGSAAFLNVAEGEFAQAVPGRPGAARFAAVENLPAIQAAARTNRFVVVVVHAGNEHQPFPPPYYQERYRAFIDAGAHMVVAHHPHIVQGVELYRDRPIFYSLGNFLFDYARREAAGHTDVGMLVQAELDEQGVAALQLRPYRAGPNAGVELLDGARFGRFMACIERLSAPLADLELLRSLWEEEARLLLEGGLRNHIARIPAALDPTAEEHQQATAVALNLFRCDAHHQSAETALRLLYEGRIESVPEHRREILALRGELAAIAGDVSAT